jgi:hypothetical protein
VLSALTFPFEDVDNRGNRSNQEVPREDARYEKVTISSAVAIEPDSKWKVIAEIAGIGLDRKEIIVDDKDGNIVSYKQA